MTSSWSLILQLKVIILKRYYVYEISVYRIILSMHGVPWLASNPDTWTGFEILISC